MRMTSLGAFSLRMCLLTALAVGVISHPAQAAGIWVGGSDSDWNNGDNWDTAPALPTGDLTINDTAGPGVFPVISSNSLITPEDIYIGNAATGRVDHTAGLLSQTTLTGDMADWVVVGRDSGTGTYNLADTAGAGGAFTGFAQGSGSLDAGKLWIGGAPVGGDVIGTGTGTVNMHTTGTVNLTGQGPFMDDWQAAFQVGRSTTSMGTLNIDSGTLNNLDSESWIGKSGTGILKISSGTLNSGRWTVFGRNDTAHGELHMTGGELHANTVNDGHLIFADGGDTTAYANISGNSVVTTTGELWVGQFGDATFEQSGGSVSSENWAAIARSGGSTAIYTISGGQLNGATRTGNFVIADNPDTTGTLNVSGDASVTSGGEFFVGDAGTATVNQSGGTVSSNRWFAIGRAGPNLGKYNLDGGTVNAVQNSDGNTVVGAFGGSQGELNITAGDFNTNNDFWLAENGTAVANISGGELDIEGSLLIAHGGDGNGTLNVLGSTAVIDVAGNFFSNEVGPGAVHFQADASGISTILVGNEVNMVNGNDMLTVDLSAYAGSDDLLLIDGLSSMGEFSNLAQGAPVPTGSLTEYTIDYSVAGDVWLRANVIPEPASYLLLGGMGLAVVAMRRRLG
ncbi:PEP-CTERM sorting domain-containing protein [Aeoliella sp.]|uniref:PEP-CTERM sorting domain-containing protein n=1 Tax=Aeoliella sp. TaxID=2795800 RepID=UPI003CCC1DEB